MTDFPSDFERQAHRDERAVDEYRRRRELEAEVGRLRADRAALLDLWIVRKDRGWQIRFQVTPSLTYLTREAADEAVLEWARSRVR
jgi:hypothetical protein